MLEIVQKKPNGEVFTTSLLVAERFGKRHKNVMQKIENLTDSTFNRLKIKPVEYLDKKGEMRKYYELNRDAFSFVAMSFTGNQADEFKLDYIEAFNRMERHLRNIMKHGWLEHRDSARLEHKAVCRTLDEVNRLKGKKTSANHYMNESRLINRAMTGKWAGIDRDSLSAEELKTLTELEAYDAVLLGAGYDWDDRDAKLKERYAELSQKLIAA